MIDTNLLLTLSQEVEKPNLFPFPLSYHIVFAVLAFIFFVYRFVTDKKPFQLIFAAAIPFSLTIHLSESRAWFYTVGAILLLMILAALASAIIFKSPETEESAEAEEDGDEDETSDEEKSDETPDTEASDEAPEEKSEDAGEDESES